MTTYEKITRITVGSFDLIRGIGIIVVVLAHTFAHLDWQQSRVLSMMHPGHTFFVVGLMPMYFMISGYGFKEKNPLNMLKKTFSSLLIPYFCVMIGYLVLYPILYLDSAFGGDVNAVWNRTLQYMIAFLMGFAPIGTPIFGFETMWNTAAWFLMAMFVTLNVLNLILQVKNRTLRLLIVAACPVLAGIMFHYRFHFFCIPQGLMGVGYCYVGYLLKRYNLLRKYSLCPWVYIVLIPLCILEAFYGGYDISQGLFKCMPIDYVGGGLAGLLTLFVGLQIGMLEWRGLDWLKKIGMYTYWIFAIHAIEMEALPWWHWQRPLADQPLLAFVLEMMAKGIIYLFGCMLIKHIIKKNYLIKTIRHQTV